MSLSELADHSRTDKNTVHSYLPLYQQLLEGNKESAKHVLEVGIFQGGSIKLWSDFFTKATVYGLDIMPINESPCSEQKIAQFRTHDLTKELSYVSTQSQAKLQWTLK